jgi:hypothetical protein
MVLPPAVPAFGKIFLVVGNLRVHHATMVTDWLADKTDRIELVFLPPYAPESNPDEYLNRHFKMALRTGPVSPDKQSLLDKATAFMKTLSRTPETVRAYFRHRARRPRRRATRRAGPGFVARRVRPAGQAGSPADRSR